MERSFRRFLERSLLRFLLASTFLASSALSSQGMAGYRSEQRSMSSDTRLSMFLKP